jgi:uncharacterized iron-regulated membrane protein
MHPELFAVAAAGTAPAQLDTAYQALRDRYGAGASYTLRPPRDPGETLQVHVRGSWEGTAYVDPGTARVVGQRGEYEGVGNFLFELHSAMLLGDAGRGVMASLALAYCFLLVTGLVLWWPAKWRQAWRLHLQSGVTRSLFDLHRVGGSLLGLLIAVSVFSGVYMAWKPLSKFVSTLAGDAPIQPPTAAPWQGARASLDAMAAIAKALFPEARIGYVQIAAQPNRPIQFRLKLPDDPHPNGLTSVWFHPGTGEAMAVHRWNQLEAGARANSYIYPLHTGALGGVLHEGLNAMFGFALSALGASGAFLWWRRRPAYSPRHAIPAVRERPVEQARQE